MIKIEPDEFNIIAKYIRSISGISLDQKKAYLIESRLKNLIKEFGCSSYWELYRKAKSDTGKSLETRIIDAITTNETLFFRDRWPFELLQHKILPDLIEMRAAKSSGAFPIRIWCAACSTGQEVYSIAMLLKESLPDLQKYDITLMGTDISATAIVQANSGIYNQFEIERGLTRDRVKRYFSPLGNNWKIRDDIRAMATFRTHNLMLPLYSSGMFDIVFCRNVSIYFNPENQKKLFYKIADVMGRDAYLIIGSTESVVGVCPRFEPGRYLRSFFYQLKN
ncbi:MAG TPA: protein-glutamate O-methyltransferase CheR [Desulfobacterales bacterium]|nr:MAG: protein-glutamate O-methyltransferase CheR [Deltaproteobacteria bacterium]HHC25392.1 protein-glutamate O-methyltransferase CheR [Desulfobacterales bacterium]